ncbi:fasciclin domain-containing protein [Aerosakkonema sp. BLCC-F183]|uniref:fasciclin domain-containing protein n=1 Tax=Aerosakkonema sp. BLCC-F183 TaxID=3342834 RepID=UPI0035B74B4A
MTSESDTIVAIASANDNFKTLTKALQAAELTETLSGNGPFTVFAPTDAAFAALPQETLQKLLLPENKALLTKILTYHVVPGKVLSSDLKTGEVKTVEGSPVRVRVDARKKQVMVNNARVTQADIQASNGVIHVIDKIIVPPELQSRLR